MAKSDGQSLAEKGLSQWARVTNVISATQFQASRLRDFGEYGDSFFVGWNVYILRRADNLAIPPQGEQQIASAFVWSTGLVTHPAFTAPLSVGDEVIMLHPNLIAAVITVPGVDVITNLQMRDVVGNKADTGITANDNVSSIMRYLKGILPQVIKSLGATPGVGNTVANWQAAEANIVQIGADNVRNKLHSLVLNINALVGTVTIRLHQQVNGVELRVYQQEFTVAADGPGLWIVNGSLMIHEVLRVTAQSNNAADNGTAIDYDYCLEVC